MPFVSILIALVVAGLFLWLVDQFPLDPAIVKMIRAVVIVVVCLWLLYVVAGFFGAGTWPSLRR